MQVFQKHHSVLGGIDEAIAVLKLCAGPATRTANGSPGWDELTVHALHEGDEISPYETVMHIEGDYSLFAHLETVYLGSLARRTLIMRNVSEVVEAARGKPILYFPARHDHWLVQTGDGWAAHIAGAIGVSTDAQASWWGGKGIGTVPHALIACLRRRHGGGGARFADRFAGETNIVVLVDFENDSVQDVARGRGGARRPALGSAARHLAHDRGPLAARQHGTLRPARRQPRARAARARRARRGRPPARAGSSSPAASTPSGSASSSASACRSTSTASAPA